jgi:hypothetical protein
LRLLRAPSVRALLCQCAAFPLTLLAVYLLAWAGTSPSYLAAAILQGGFAAVLTWRWGLAPWWSAICLLFPLAAYGMSGLNLPPWLFLAVFLFMLVLYWSTFRTQVPYYPSGKTAWVAVEEQLPAQLPQGRPVRVIDIGSGLGGLVLHLARRRADVDATGIELAPLPWLASRLRARLTGSRARFMRGDYERLDFGNYDAVFAYLSPAAMSALWRKARREMAAGSMLMSYEFAIPEAPPTVSLYLQDTGRTLYIWHF